MTYHYEDVKDKWNESTDGHIGWDIPLKITEEYKQASMAAAVGLAIGYYIGKHAEA